MKTLSLTFAIFFMAMAGVVIFTEKMTGDNVVRFYSFLILGFIDLAVFTIISELKK